MYEAPPLTRPKTLRVSLVVMKLAVWPEPTLNLSKLWKRLAPLRVPPWMLNSCPRGVTVVPVPSLAGVMSWELAGAPAKVFSIKLKAVIVFSFNLLALMRQFWLYSTECYINFY